MEKKRKKPRGKIVLYGNIEEEKFYPEVFRDWLNALSIYNDERVLITISLPQKPVSSQEIRYLFGVVYKIISDYTGDDKDSLHEFFKLKFLSRTKEGNIAPHIPSLTDLTTVETEGFLENIRRFAAQELGLFIPLPNENEMWGDFYGKR